MTIKNETSIAEVLSIIADHAVPALSDINTMLAECTSTDPTVVKIIDCVELITHYVTDIMSENKK